MWILESIIWANGVPVNCYNLLLVWLLGCRFVFISNLGHNVSSNLSNLLLQQRSSPLLHEVAKNTFVHSNLIVQAPGFYLDWLSLSSGYLMSCHVIYWNIKPCSLDIKRETHSISHTYISHTLHLLNPTHIMLILNQA